MKLFDKKINAVLMHKDIPVLNGKYSYNKHGFEHINVIMNAKHLPVGLVQNDNLSLHALNHWWRWRAIPDYRVDLRSLQENLGLTDIRDLIEEDHGLSLSDTYWIKQKDEKISWNEIEYFHSYYNEEFAKAMFCKNITVPSSAKKSPNNILCGYQRKAWVKRNGEDYLLKGGSLYQQEPVNEWLASQIAKQLGLYAIDYDTEIYHNQLVSVCKRFTNENVDLVTCEYILNPNVQSCNLAYKEYLHVLESHGIQHAKKYLSDQMLLDYLLMNTDRHTQNMGILVDANTNEWLDIAPVFDTGTSLGCLVSDYKVVSQEHENKCQLFNIRNMSHDVLLNYILFDQYDFSNLQELPRKYGNKLVEYRNITNISDERIENSYTLFYKRILSLKKAARSHV